LDYYRKVQVMVMPARILEPVIELIKLFGAVVNFESLSKVRWVLKLTPGKRVIK